MPFTMKIQPIDIDSPTAVRETTLARPEPPSITNKPVLKSRLKRLFDRPFTNVLRSSTTSEKPLFPAVEVQSSAVVPTEFEPSSVCLAKMVQNFIEENNEKQAKCGRNRCNCFNGNNDSSSDDESDLFDSFIHASDHLKSLIPCASVTERNLLADAARIVDKNKSVKRKEEMRKIVNQGLLSLNYNSSICKSKWDKSPSFPAGEYEYIDVVVAGEGRLLLDVDFRSEFDIARQTSGYKSLFQSLPFIFVGKSERLSQIVALVSEAAKVSLKKRGMHLPPWRKAEYMRSKWLSSYTRAVSVVASGNNVEEPPPPTPTPVMVAATVPELDCAELELVFEEKSLSPFSSCLPSVVVDGCDGDDDVAVEREVKAGLASLFKEKP